MPKRLLVIQHDHVSPPGPVGERFEERGYEVATHAVVAQESFHAPGVVPAFPDFTAFDAIIAMGAPWSTYDHQLVGSWVLPEIDELRRADASGVPVLGICFGGQLLAAAHGGSVSASAVGEIGWTHVDSDEAELVPRGLWFQWHYDSWAVPPGAVELARNRAASQAFMLRRNLAVQFHPELTSTMLEGWFGNGGGVKAAAFGQDPSELLRRTRALENDSRRRARQLVDAFLDRVAVASVVPSAAPRPG